MALYDNESLIDKPPASALAQPSSVYPSPELVSEPPGTPGIGIAPAEKPELTTSQKVGRALYNYSAGYRGQPSFEQVEENRAIKKKQADLDELKGTVTALEHGISMRQGMSGDDATAFDEAYGNKLEAIQPGMKQTFLALTKKPDLLTQFQGYAPYLPEPVQAMMRAQPKEFLKFAGTAEGMKVMMDAKDRFDMRTATKKVQTAMIGLKEFLPPEEYAKVMEDGVLTASDVVSAQKYLPEAARLSDNELGAIQRNDKIFWQGLGVLHGQGEQDVLKRRAEAKDKNKQPESKTIDGIVYQWDPAKGQEGTRLKTDDRYVALGSGKDPADKKRTVDIELKLSDDYRQDTKKFKELRANFDSTTDYMANRDKEKTSAGDAALAFAYAKMRDPNDRLAVSETRDLAKLGNIFERIGANITGVLDKGETLPDRVANEMYKEIRRRFGDLNKAQAGIEADYTKRVKDYGGDHTRVVRPMAIPEEQLNPKRREADKPGVEAKGGDQNFADPGAVKAAFDAGKISRAQAKAALKKFGFNN